MGLGPPEIILILLVVFLLFGAKRLPELARSGGEALKEWKKGMREAMADDDDTARPLPKSEDTAQRRMEAPAPEPQATTTDSTTV